MEVDASCPQQADFEIVRCTGHQHIGARCITLYNAETNETICRSCPVLGTQQGAQLLQLSEAVQSCLSHC